MINFTVYSADCVGNSGNCLYPNKMIVSDRLSRDMEIQKMLIRSSLRR